MTTPKGDETRGRVLKLLARKSLPIWAVAHKAGCTERRVYQIKAEYRREWKSRSLVEAS